MRKHHRVSVMYRRNESAVSAMVSDLCSAIGSSFAENLLKLYFDREFAKLVDLEIDPSSYNDPDSFRDDYLLCSLLSKADFLPTGIDTKAAALAKFRQAELQCSEANLRLEELGCSGSLYSVYTPMSILWLAKEKIASLLGPFHWADAEPHFGFGPGSTTRNPRRKGDAYFKYGAVRPHSTIGNFVPAWCAVKRIPRWYGHLIGLSDDTYPIRSFISDDSEIFEFVAGNKVATVPKNAKSDRVIAVEPCMNMYIQKGIGGVIADRLLRVGIDLRDQSRNRSLACEGSVSRSLATIDLSSASDTMCYQLVKELIPDDWFSALERSRCPVGTLPSGEVISYQKWSSMGNGYTFQLETLIFWSLAASIRSLLKIGGPISVYGDDIIIPSQMYGTMRWMLEYCGFSVNPKKSFSHGPFRESCGKHFWNGRDVTPFYIRKDIDSPSRLIWAANSVRRWARSPVYGLDGRFKQTYDTLVGRLPVSLRKPMSSDGSGDISLIGDFDEVRPSRSKRLQAYLSCGFSDLRPQKVLGGTPWLLRSLDRLEQSVMPSLEGGVPSGLVLNPKVNWRFVQAPVHQWESYGPWLGP